MSVNEYISIIDGKIITVNVNINDVWSLNVINANFMLNKYNGRGPTLINIILFSNLGDGLFGEIEFYINNYQCFKSSVNNISDDSNSYFTVTPKYITLNGKDSTSVINVSSDCNWDYEPKENNNFSISMGTNNLTITSRDNNLFEYEEIIVTNCNGLTETVYVSQKEINTTNNVLEVSPQYIELSGDNKEFTISVISICNGSINYNYNNISGITLNKQNNTINGKINDEVNGGNYELIINNGCFLKTVKIKYSKESDVETFLLIKDGEKYSSSVTYTFKVDTSVSYDVLSSTRWYIIDYDSDRLQCTQNDNTINISLGENKTKYDNARITLKNDDNLFAYINCNISGGIVTNDVIFGFVETSESDSSIVEELSVTANTANNYEFSANVVAYNTKEKKELKWINFSFDDFKTENKENIGGSLVTPKNIKFKVTDRILEQHTNSNNPYIIELFELNTKQIINIKVTIQKTCDEETTWTSLSVSASDMAKCDTASSTLTVTANGIISNTACTTSATTTTLSPNDYTVTYSPSGTNETNNDMEISIIVIGKGNYSGLSGSTSVTQAAGPCKEQETPEQETVYEYIEITPHPYDEECNLSLTVKAYGYSGETEFEEELTINEDYDVTYDPSGENDSGEERDIEVTVEGKGKYSGLTDSIEIVQPYCGEKCDEKTTWSSLTVSVADYTMDKCKTEIPSSALTVTANGTHTKSDCSTASTSSTLSHNDYTVTYEPSGANETSSSRPVTITVIGKRSYDGLTGSTTVTQANGPCTNNFVFVDSGTTTNIDYLSGTNELVFVSTKNGSVFTSITANETCDWLEIENITYDDNGVIKLEYDVTENTRTETRSCGITLTQAESNKKLTYQITQSKFVEQCMTISYTLSGSVACNVYFKTTNGTQQGSHYVDATGSQSLCNVADGTELVVSCDDSDVIVEGDTSFTYSNKGGNVNIRLTKNVITQIIIKNNLPGSITVNKSTVDTNNSQTYQDNELVNSITIPISVSRDSMKNKNNGNLCNSCHIDITLSGNNLSVVSMDERFSGDINNYQWTPITDYLTQDFSDEIEIKHGSAIITVKVENEDNDPECETSSTFVRYEDVENTTDSYDGAEMNCDFVLTKGMLDVKGYTVYNNLYSDCSTSAVTSSTKVSLGSSEYTLDINPSGNNTGTTSRSVTATIKYGNSVVDTITYTQKTGSTCVGDKTGVTYQYDLQVSDVSIGKCDTTASPTVQGRSMSGITHTDGSETDWGNWTDWSNLSSSNYSLSYSPSLAENNTTSQKTYTVTATGSGSYAGLSDTATVTQAVGPCKPVEKTCNPLHVEYSDNTKELTCSFDEMVDCDVSITVSYSFGLANGSKTITISDGNNSGSATLQITQSVTSTANTSLSVDNVSPSSSDTYEYNCKVTTKVIPSTPTIKYDCNLSVPALGEFGRNGGTITGYVQSYAEGSDGSIESVPVSVSNYPNWITITIDKDFNDTEKGYKITATASINNDTGRTGTYTITQNSDYGCSGSDNGSFSQESGIVSMDVVMTNDSMVEGTLRFEYSDGTYITSCNATDANWTFQGRDGESVRILTEGVNVEPSTFFVRVGEYLYLTIT